MNTYLVVVEGLVVAGVMFLVWVRSMCILDVFCMLGGVCIFGGVYMFGEDYILGVICILCGVCILGVCNVLFEFCLCACVK